MNILSVNHGNSDLTLEWALVVVTDTPVGSASLQGTDWRPTSLYYDLNPGGVNGFSVNGLGYPGSAWIAGTFTCYISVYSGAGFTGDEATISVPITFIAEHDFTVSPSNNINCAKGQSFEASVTFSGGVAPYDIGSTTAAGLLATYGITTAGSSPTWTFGGTPTDYGETGFVAYDAIGNMGMVNFNVSEYPIPTQVQCTATQVLIDARSGQPVVIL
jgi:hypothetical protein